MVQKRLVVQAKIRKCLDIVVLLDGSASISSEAFLDEKKGIKAFIERIYATNKDVYLALIQFGTLLKPALTLRNSNVANLLQEIDAVVQIGGSTNLGDGLLEAKKQLNLSRDSLKYVIVFTDGDPSNFEQATKNAALLKGENIVIVCVGVGKSVTKFKLEQISSLGCSFLITSFSEINNLDILKESYKISRPNVIVHMDPPSLGLQDNLTLKLKIDNQTDNCIPKESRVIFFDKNEHFLRNTVIIEEDILQYKNRTLNVELIPDKVDMKSLPPYVEFLIEYQNKEIFSGFITLEVQNFSKDITERKPIHGGFYRITFVGVPGAGKSTVLKTLDSAFGSEVVQGSTFTGSGVEHATRQMETRMRIGPNIEVKDTFGYNTRSYPPNTLKYVLMGQVEDNYKLESKLEDDKRLRQYKEKCAQNPEYTAPLEDRTNAVALVYDQASIASTEHGKDYKDCLETVISLGLQPTVLVTKFDNLRPEIASRPFGEFADVENQMTNIADSMGLPRQSVKIAISYTESTKKLFEVDKNTYLILESLLNSADQYISAQLSLKRAVPISLASPVPTTPVPTTPTIFTISAPTDPTLTTSTISAPAPTTVPAERHAKAIIYHEEKQMSKIISSDVTFDSLLRSCVSRWSCSKGEYVLTDVEGIEYHGEDLVLATLKSVSNNNCIELFLRQI